MMMMMTTTSSCLDRLILRQLHASQRAPQVGSCTPKLLLCTRVSTQLYGLRLGFRAFGLVVDRIFSYHGKPRLERLKLDPFLLSPADERPGVEISPYPTSRLPASDSLNGPAVGGHRLRYESNKVARSVLIQRC